MHLHLVACPSVTIPRMSESGVEVGYMVVGLHGGMLEMFIFPVGRYTVLFQTM